MVNVRKKRFLPLEFWNRYGKPISILKKFKMEKKNNFFAKI